jgi:hypothetical protein
MQLGLHLGYNFSRGTRQRLASYRRCALSTTSAKARRRSTNTQPRDNLRARAFAGVSLPCPRTFAGTTLKSAMAPEIARGINLGTAPRGGRFDATTERDRRDCRGQLELFCLVGVLQFDPPARCEPLGPRDRALPSRAIPLSRQRYVFA